MQKKIRFGIIGCSKIAESSTIPAIMASPYAELAQMGSRDPQKAEQFAKKFNCKNHGTYEDVLTNNNIDAIYISTPVGLHEEWSIKASKAGKHTLCEKSSTTSYSSAKNMVDVARRNNVRLMEGFMFRFHPSHKKVLDLIRNGVLGNIFSFYGRYGFQSVSKNDIRYKKELGGGILNDAVCYPICASRIIFGKEPLEVMCNLKIDKETEIDERALLTINYDQDQVAQMVVGYGLFYQSLYSVWGTLGMLRLSRSYNIPQDMPASLVINSNTENKELTLEPANHFALMINGFCKDILGIETSGFNFENDLLNQAKVMEAARLSHVRNRPVELTEIT